MKLVKFFLLFSTLLSICSCRGCFRTVSDEILPPGGNPELIKYLQGTWVLSSDDKLVLQIKRDSITTLYKDSLKSTRTLSYLFAGAAESFFTKDSAFDFSSESGSTLSSDEFRLVENGSIQGDTITHLLAFVSKSALRINTNGKFADFKKR